MFECKSFLVPQKFHMENQSQSRTYCDSEQIQKLIHEDLKNSGKTNYRLSKTDTGYIAIHTEEVVGLTIRDVVKHPVASRRLKHALYRIFKPDDCLAKLLNTKPSDLKKGTKMIGVKTYPELLMVLTEICPVSKNFNVFDQDDFNRDLRND